MPKNLITVRAQIGKCVYEIEMDEKDSLHSMQLEIEIQMELKNQEIEILEIYDQFNPKTTRPHKNGNTNAHPAD